MPVLIRTRQALVKCKACGAQTPSLTRGVPVLPAQVPCTVCGRGRFIGPLKFSSAPCRKFGKVRLCADMPAPERNHVQVVRCKGCKRCVPISVDAVSAL